jgi:hypothetical protein
MSGDPGGSVLKRWKWVRFRALTTYDDLEDALRLEVSGVDKGVERVVKARLAAKLEQARCGHSNLPAMAGVVGFLSRLILLRRVQE